MDKISDLKNIIISTLDSNKAIDIVSIDLKNKSSMADYMIIASGTSSRHIQALSEQVLEKFRTNGIINCKIEGELKSLKENKSIKLESSGKYDLPIKGQVVYIWPASRPDTKAPIKI